MSLKQLRRAGLGLVLSVLLCGIPSVTAGQSAPQWLFSGQNLSNSRNQPVEMVIGSGNVGTLTPAWVFQTGGSVSATPTVDGNAVYFPDWFGSFFALDEQTGQLLWSHNVSDYNGNPGSISRNSPAVHGNSLIVGDVNPVAKAAKTGAHVMSVDKRTGNLLWIRAVDTHPFAVITQSPVVYRGVVYVGISSQEELAAGAPQYKCCSFHGSVVALSATTGKILWKTYMAPSGYTGAAVWSSSPVVDPKRQLLYVATGNNYTVPKDVAACQKANPNSSSCVASNDYFDAVVAL